MRHSVTLCALAALASSCGPGATQQQPPPEKLSTTYRVIGGVSMGGIGAAALGLSRPERFDGVAMLGGPLDAAYFQRMLDQFVTGGWCTKAELEAILAQDPVKLNDPSVIDACARPATPMKWEHRNDFNHWHTTHNGGTFDRESYGRMVTDLSLAFGNLLTENPASPVAPPGVDPEKIRHFPSDFCTNPIVVKGLKNLEFNPDGRYDAITFCDGEPTLFFCRDTMERVDFCSAPANIATPLPVAQEEPFANTFCANKGGAVRANKSEHTLFWLANTGRVDPCRQPREPQGIILAFDYNGNGRRDYGEPIVNNSHERYDDVGADGCADAFEDGNGGCNLTGGASGDPNKDNYEADGNPFGAEQNWRWDQGEPFRDDGLDGVPGSGDFGEGNGRHDVTSGRQRLFELDGRTNFARLDEKSRKRVNIVGDGGIRDIFNLGLMAKHLFSAVKGLRGDVPVGEYRDFVEIPGMKDRRTGNFNPWNRAWKNVPRDLLTLYGKDQPTPEDLQAGEGDHVGTASQAVYRFSVVFNWVASMWPNLERPATPFGGSGSDRQRVESFHSEKLGAMWEYSIALPPGYDAPENADQRYPVTYLLHGYGMDPQGFMATGLITDAYVMDTDVQLRPVIYVYPNGRCCFVNQTTGGRDCRSTDDMGNELDRMPGWERECNSGTFWVNRRGYTPGDETLYGDAMFELMDYIDQKYRTLPAAEVEAR
ncbi:MAG: alpha/beta hydrolase-fold protein [Myxococcota bacterium]